VLFHDLWEFIVWLGKEGVDSNNGERNFRCQKGRNPQQIVKNLALHN